MGTRGYYVFRYKNKWYVFYNHWDSYPSSLGQQIVNELIDFDFEQAKKYIDQITYEDLNTDGGRNFEGLMVALKNPNTYAFEQISDKDVGVGNYIEFVYTIDLDRNWFDIEYIREYYSNTQRFRLNAIPNDWMDMLSKTD